MNRTHQSVALLMAALVCLVSLPFDFAGLGAEEDKEETLEAFAKLERGMTTKQVRNRLGAPKHIARQILYHRSLEQWIYEVPLAVRLTFDCPRGRKPQLLYFPRLAAENDKGGRRAKGR